MYILDNKTGIHDSLKSNVNINFYHVKIMQKY